MTSLILLHSAIGAATQLAPLAAQLQDTCEVHTFNFYGHGGEPSGNKDFSIKGFAEQLATFINDLSNSNRVNIFGYSMGGYAAMYMARHMNINIGKIITLGTKFHWDEATAAKECKMLQPDIIEQKVAAFAQQLNQRHHPQSWKQVLNQTAEMLQQMGKENPLAITDYKHIQTPSLIMLGDKDKMVTRDETINVYEQLPNAQLAILPGTPHPIEQTNPSIIAFHIHTFLNQQ